jgi:hypothetical protein
LKAYWHARKIYLEIGFSIKNGSNPLLVLTNYQDQLFQIIQESPEFRPADDTLNSLAAALQTSNPEIANKVIDKLQNIKKSAVQ